MKRQQVMAMFCCCPLTENDHKSHFYEIKLDSTYTAFKILTFLPHLYTSHISVYDMIPARGAQTPV